MVTFTEMKPAIPLVVAGIALLLGAPVCSADPSTYDAVLSALNKPGHDWAIRLDELEKSLTATGTDPADARAAILVTIRNTGVPTGWEIEIVRLSRNIGAVMGTGIAQETRLLTEALGTGYSGISAYGLSRGLTAADLVDIRNTIFDRATTIDLVLTRLKSHFAGKYEELRGTGQR